MSRYKKYLGIVDKENKSNWIFDSEQSHEAFFEYFCVASGERKIVFGINRTPLDLKKDTKLARLFNFESLYLTGGGNSYFFAGKKSVVTLLKYFILLTHIELSSELMHYIIGRLCQIPDCCIKKYFEHDMDILSLSRDYKKQLNGKNDTYRIKIRKNSVEQFLINYVPCSPECKQTENIFRRCKLVWKQKFDMHGMSAKELMDGLKPEQADFSANDASSAIDKIEQFTGDE